MKKLLIVSMLIAGTFAGIGVASASSVGIIGISGWQLDAFSGSDK